MSLCAAILLRSLVTICMIGSTPFFTRMELAAMLDMRTTAVWLSVTLAASQ